MASVIEEVHSRWFTYFPTLQYSAQEFYTHIEKQIEAKKVSSIRVRRVNFGGLFSKREYLRIRENDLIFDVCLASYGTGCFISWWMGESKGSIYKLLAKIPFIRFFLELRATYKPYIQWDYITMFQECVRASILEAIDIVTTDKDIRKLTEAERMVTDRRSIIHAK